MIKRLITTVAILFLVGCAQQTTEERLRGGSAEDVYSLGLMHLYGQEVPINRELAMQYLTSSAERGSLSARYKLGIIYDKVGNMDEAIYWYKQAAETPYMGHPMYRLAEIYKYGIGTNKNLDAALSYYLKTAKLGYKSSMIELSKLYYDKKNYKEAYVWAKVIEISGVNEIRGQAELISFQMKPLDVLKLDKKARLYATLYLHKI